MEYIGKINDREIFYISIRGNLNWQNSLPVDNWVAFTISDNDDKEMLNDCTIEILDKNVTYTCSAGKLCHLAETYFDQEIAWRGAQYEEKYGKEFDYNKSPMTTAHRNFDEGFWFASTLAYTEESKIDKVVCVDFTKRNVKNHLLRLIEKINNSWLPSDKEIELPEYDS